MTLKNQRTRLKKKKSKNPLKKRVKKTKLLKVMRNLEIFLLTNSKI